MMKYLIWMSRECNSLHEVAAALKKISDEVALLLVQDGVFMIDKGCPHSSEVTDLGLTVFASKHHVEERGIGGRLVVKPTLVDYSEMVDLIMEQFDRVVSL
ncbi:MAG: hypothetical protein GF411_19575 [Candidatus Lokiarchaeota archaeon]|nr:hypothetical protein [Candidatus Lokiarchaeota archaeon]